MTITSFFRTFTCRKVSAKSNCGEKPLPFFHFDGDVVPSRAPHGGCSAPLRSQHCDGERVKMSLAWFFFLLPCTRSHNQALLQAPLRTIRGLWLPLMRHRNQILNKERAFAEGENNSGGSGGSCMLKWSAGSWHVAERTGVRERDKAALYELNNDIFTINRGVLLPPRGKQSSGKSPLLISSAPVKLASPSCCLVAGAGAHRRLGAAAGCCRRSRSWAPASF